MWLRGVLVWLLIAVAETLHGIARVAFVQPRIGDLPARQVALFSGALIICAIAFVTIRWIGAVGARRQFALGALWMVLMVGFDMILGRFAFGYSWARVSADFNPLAGGYLGVAMLVLLLAPWLAARLRSLN
jgi:hypothetical protein